MYPKGDLFDCDVYVHKITRANFIDRGFHEKEFKNTRKQVAEMDRNELLRDLTGENKDP